MSMPAHCTVGITIFRFGLYNGNEGKARLTKQTNKPVEREEI